MGNLARVSPPRVRHTSARIAIPPICCGCNEPGPFPERDLDRGTPSSLLMAFPGTGNNWVTSTDAANRLETHLTALDQADLSRPDPGDSGRSPAFSPCRHKAKSERPAPATPTDHSDGPGGNSSKNRTGPANSAASHRGQGPLPTRLYPAACAVSGNSATENAHRRPGQPARAKRGPRTLPAACR
jgi:hypothetical protein